jgi:hypothetical protein
MRKLESILISICLFIPLSGINIAIEKATIISRGNIILYVVDSVWTGWRGGCFCYTNKVNGRTEIDVDPGIHTIEFKYPSVGWGGRIYSATFNTEPGKTYIITQCDTNNYYPMIINQLDKSKAKDVILKQISLPKPDSKTIKLSSTEKDDFATLISNCCSGFYNLRGKLQDLGSVIRIFKIDDIWGPYSTGWDVAFNSAWDGKFNIELAPGTHKFCLAVYSADGIHSTNIPVKNNKIKSIDIEKYFSSQVIYISANLEAGKTYGFDYKLCFRTELESPDFYYDIKIVEVPSSQ